MNVVTRPQRTFTDRRFFISAANGIAAIVFIGFARTYYLRTLFGMPAMPLLVHAHGLIMTSWIVLFFTQTCLIAAHRVDWHRRFGMFGAVLAGLIVVVGTIVTVHAAAGAVQIPPTRPPGFLRLLGFNLINLLIFASLVGSAIVLRRRSDCHKRLMLLDTLSLLPPAIGRIPVGFMNPVVNLLLVDLCVLLPVAIDTFRNHWLHPAFGWGALLILVAFNLTYLGVQTQTWMRFATWLVS